MTSRQHQALRLGLKAVSKSSLVERSSALFMSSSANIYRLSMLAFVGFASHKVTVPTLQACFALPLSHFDTALPSLPPLAIQPVFDNPLSL
jgi:hypothetical protein